MGISRDLITPLLLLLFHSADFVVFSTFAGIPLAPPPGSSPKDPLHVGITLVNGAAEIGAVCLDGSPPAYHLHSGSGSGADKWLLQFEGGGWCSDVESCLARTRTHRGSSRYMNRLASFNGILSDDPSLNPDFYNWNRVKLRYCDGASFTGDSEFYDGNAQLYFRGQRIWRAIVSDLLSRGMINAKEALLSGCSAGALAAILHCDDFASLLPKHTSLKCLSDGGLFLDVKDVSGTYTMRSFFQGVVLLQEVIKSLPKQCTRVQEYPAQCFSPQYELAHIQKPVFLLNSAYDVYQLDHILVPPSADPHGQWRSCKKNLASCTSKEILSLQGFRDDMLTTLRPLLNSSNAGIFVNSCFAHCQSELQETWYASDSPRLHNKTIAEAIGDWYFERGTIREIGCPYPCDQTCHNLLPSPDAAPVGVRVPVRLSSCSERTIQGFLFVLFFLFLPTF